MCIYLECGLVNYPTILLYNITISKRMTAHLSHDNTIIQCANESWGINFWNGKSEVSKHNIVAKFIHSMLYKLIHIFVLKSTINKFRLNRGFILF